ncbi:hypothetical protein CA13_26240 [Planctomycetes bacterium CA13]|uniref:PEP-CTERM protein-sorting domain-containing protein n=1 Tax=Novipirellula herctigrandis TaxID=2527986 RepID=A0A5C5Z2D1_9BACT|nr:hypothetical protein CA13_26240 [Planctomycetes bacterium CA13]
MFSRLTHTVVAFLLLSLPAQAGMMTGLPDIFATPFVKYDSASGQITAIGSAIQFKTSSEVQAIFPGTGKTTPYGIFNFKVAVDSNRQVQGSNNNFSILGALDSSEAQATLLSGTITELNSAAFSSGVLEFTAVNITGGLSDAFGETVVISFSNLAAGTNFLTEKYSPADVNVSRPVPEPVSIAIWGMTFGLGLLGTYRRRLLAPSARTSS